MSKLLNPEEMTSRITTLTPTPTLGSTRYGVLELVAKRGELGPAATARFPRAASCMQFSAVSIS